MAAFNGYGYGSTRLRLGSRVRIADRLDLAQLARLRERGERLEARRQDLAREESERRKSRGVVSRVKGFVRALVGRTRSK